MTSMNGNDWIEAVEKYPQDYFERCKYAKLKPLRDSNFEGIDKEMRELIKWMNVIPGIVTTSCCFGHGKVPTMIFFCAKDNYALYSFVTNCLYSFTAWELKISLADPGVMPNGEFTYYLETRTSDMDANFELIFNLVDAITESYTEDGKLTEKSYTRSTNRW